MTEKDKIFIDDMCALNNIASAIREGKNENS